MVYWLNPRKKVWGGLESKAFGFGTYLQYLSILIPKGDSTQITQTT